MHYSIWEGSFWLQESENNEYLGKICRNSVSLSNVTWDANLTKDGKQRLGTEGSGFQLLIYAVWSEFSSGLLLSLEVTNKNIYNYAAQLQ